MQPTAQAVGTNEKEMNQPRRGERIAIRTNDERRKKSWRPDPDQKSAKTSCHRKKLDLATVRETHRRRHGHDAAEKTGRNTGARSKNSPAATNSKTPFTANSQGRFRMARHRLAPWILKVMGASLGLAGMTGCVRLPLEPIGPLRAPAENVVPGRPMYYATAVTLGGYASPVLVESHLGARPKSKATICIRRRSAARCFHAGLHPWPLRSRPLAERHFMGDQRSWAAFLGAIRGPSARRKALAGRGLRILTPTISSPTLADQLRNFLKIYPQASGTSTSRSIETTS